jgi:type IV pilus assembly protein PilX
MSGAIMSFPSSFRVRPHRQQGSTLVVGLIMLLVITVISLSALQMTTLQQRMAGNVVERNIAFQAAEIALRQAEDKTIAANVFKVGDPGQYDTSSTTCSFCDDVGLASITWASLAAGNKSKEIAYAVYQSKYKPRVVIVQQTSQTQGGSLEAGIEKTVQVFKVNAWGVGAATLAGGEPAAPVVLQTTYKKP